MWIMTAEGWKRIATKAIAAPIGGVENDGYAYQEKWRKMSFDEQYIELVNLNIHKGNHEKTFVIG